MKNKADELQCFLAHVDPDTGRKQSVKEHLEHVCYLSEKNCPLDILKNLVYVAAVLHDAGKLRETFQEYMQQILKYGNNAKRQNIDHASAGGRLMEEITGERFVSKMVGTVICSHHGQQDCIDLETGEGLAEKRREKEVDYETVKNRYYQMYDAKLLTRHMLDAHHDIQSLYKHINDMLFQFETNKYGTIDFFLGMYERLLLSILIDSDWTDSASFSEGQPLPERISEEEILKIWDKAIWNFDVYRKNLSSAQKGSRLNQYRNEISEVCYKTSQEEQKLYRLTVPTGAGKTLASLRFALYHAKKYRKRHIFYVAPYNSILEQNADSIRKAVGEERYVLEHHCNVLHDDMEKEELYKKLTENWDSPMIVTTAVQMLNTLFSGQKSSIRRMYNLCGSVIIFDEVQAFPVRCTELFHLAVNFLTRFCDTTVLLCSATQPSMAHLEENNVWECREMTEDAGKYMEAFRRTEIVDRTDLVPGGMDIEYFRDFILETARKSGTVLAVVNTKKAAREAYQSLKSFGCEEYEPYHLSTNMCPKNRKDELEKIKRALEEKKKVICVSTQLVEAGVDFSFGCVIRSLAGLDNIIQAAGRCNRHKEREDFGKVYIVRLSPEVERIGQFYEMKAAQRTCERLLYEFRQEPEAFAFALDSQAAIKRYYDLYYDELGNEMMKYPVVLEGGLAETNLVELLGKNDVGKNQYVRLHNGEYPKLPLNQAFKTAGKVFEVIPDDEKLSVIVPYDETANRLIARLECPKLVISEQKMVLRKLQPYTVGISKYIRERLNNAVYSAGNTQVLILNPDYYDRKTGVLETPVNRFLDF